MPTDPLYLRMAQECEARKLRLEMCRHQGGRLELRVLLPSGGMLRSGFNPTEPADGASQILAQLALRA